MIYISDIYTTAPTDERVATEKKVYQILDRLKISYERVDNDVVETMEECEEIDKALGTEIRKSIFLCNKKKTSFFLIVLPANKSLDTNALSKKNRCAASVFCVRRIDGGTSWDKTGICICHGIDQR